jgi:hypothetical protein
MMDARSQITHDAALVARIATWLRGKTPGLTSRIISDTAILLSHAMPSTVPAANPMACGWAEEPGADERFGAWRSSMAWGGQHHANLIHIAAGALYLCSDSPVRPGVCLDAAYGAGKTRLSRIYFAEITSIYILSRIVLFRLKSPVGVCFAI